MESKRDLLAIELQRYFGQTRPAFATRGEAAIVGLIQRGGKEQWDRAGHQGAARLPVQWEPLQMHTGKMTEEERMTACSHQKNLGLLRTAGYRGDLPLVHSRGDTIERRFHRSKYRCGARSGSILIWQIED